MAQPIDLVNNHEKVVFGNDNVVIVNVLATIPSGKALDVTDVAQDTLFAGHPIITDGNGTYKPMPVKGTDTITYDSLPEGYKYVGILTHSMATKKPFASIMIAGTVNKAAVPYDFATIVGAVKTAVPTINFIADEVVSPAPAAESAE